MIRISSKHVFKIQIFFILASLITSSNSQVGCPESNGRWPDPTQCDAYVECIDGIGENKLCPDGLVYSPERYHSSYPCIFPQEADCSSRPNLQPAQPTAECPHQFGMYALGDANNCGQFMTCSHGKGYIQNCPEGLAYNDQIARCDWPDLVQSCNAEAYLGFQCPPNSPDSYFGTDYSYYRSPTSCDKFFICLSGRPRLLICPSGTLFDSDTNICLPEQNVTSCGGGSFGPNQNIQSFQASPPQNYDNNYFG